MNQSIRDGRAEEMVVKAAGLILLFSLLIYVPIISIFAPALCCVPVVVTTVRYGPEYGVASVLLAGILMLLFRDYISVLVILTTAASIGISEGIAVREGSNSFEVTFYGLLARLAAIVLVIMLVQLFLGKDFIISLLNTVKEAVRSESETFLKTVYNQASFQTVIKETVSKLLVLIPFFLFLESWLMAAFSTFISGKVLGHLNFITPKKIKFSHFRLHPLFSWGFLLGLAATLFSSQFGQAAKLVSIFGQNMLLVFESIFLLQGIAIIVFISTFRKINPVLKFSFITFSLVAQFLFKGVSWLGLIDTWFNYRKLAYDPE